MRPFDVLDITFSGESHSPEISATMRGLPVGTVFSAEAVEKCMARRRSGRYLFSTPRREADVPEWRSGIARDGDALTVTGDITVAIANNNVRPGDYPFARTPRPSHADYVAYVKDGERAAKSGGGRFSGRMTALLTALGGAAKDILAKRSVTVDAYISRMAGVDTSAGRLPSPEEIRACHELPLPVLSHLEEAKDAAAEAAKRGDSTGGVVECVIRGLPAGLGDALWRGLESKLAAAVYGIPAVKCVEFGAGALIADMTGSTANDPFSVEDGKVVTLTNNAGGLNGGVTNGMPVVLRAAFRPTPTISLPQRTVDLELMRETTLTAGGRHDATVVPRAVVVVECTAALAVLDELLFDSYLKRL